jgi:hypothetical protein
VQKCGQAGLFPGSVRREFLISCGAQRFYPDNAAIRKARDRRIRIVVGLIFLHAISPFSAFNNQPSFRGDPQDRTRNDGECNTNLRGF